jgi:hypothetical protein
VENSGLFQRVAIVTGFSCMSALAARLASQLATTAGATVASDASLGPYGVSHNHDSRRVLAPIRRVFSRLGVIRHRTAESLSR